jgi:hypothetical protein
MLEGFTALLTSSPDLFCARPSQMSIQVACLPYFILERGPSVPMILLLLLPSFATLRKSYS